jgi:virginiamycin B lyase
MRFHRPLTVAALALAALPAFASAQQKATPDPVDFREWKVPWENTRPRDPIMDKSGAVWFVGQQGHYVGRLDPRTGEFKKYDLEQGAGPHNVIIDSKGQPWYTGNRSGYIGRLDPATGKVTQYKMPDPAVRDPHTMIEAPDGNFWFTAQGAGYMGRLNPGTGKVDLIKLPTQGARPYGIEIDSKGRPWAVELGTNRIATVDPKTLELKEYTLPDAGSRPRRIGITSDDKIWYGDWAKGRLGRLDPATGEVKEWPLPSGEQSGPYAMATDDRGRVWVVETRVQPNRFVGFDSKTEKFIGSFPVPSGGGTVRHMTYNPSTREIWFGADVGTIGRALVSPVIP